MPHRQQQTDVDRAAKRQRSKDKSKEPKKRVKTTTKEWKATPSNVENSTSTTEKPSIVPNQITFGRFEFKSEDSVDIDSKKKKKGKKQPTKQKQLINQLKQVENEQNEINRLKEENLKKAKHFYVRNTGKQLLPKQKARKFVIILNFYERQLKNKPNFANVQRKNGRRISPRPINE